LSVKLEHLQAHPLIYPLQVLRVEGQTVSVVNLVRIRKMKLVRWDTKEIIFEAECDSWSELIEGALKEGVSLKNADLENVNLAHADLENVSFENANLENANLRNARLINVNLVNARLRNSSLIFADLKNANLENVRLNYLIADMNIFHSMQLDTYYIAFDKEILAIGCQQHTIAEWKNFTDDEISEMDDNALIWLKKWKTFIFEAIRLSLEGK